jgi:murein DD-endopeptidase MepM/ murein hydrolase activator NlpD
MLKKITNQTILLVGLLIFLIIGIYTVSTYDFRSEAANIYIPGAKYTLYYQLNDNQNNIFNSNPKFKKSLITAINKFTYSTKNEIYITDVQIAGSNFVVLLKIVEPSTNSEEEGYLTGDLVKVLFVQQIDGSYSYSVSTNLALVRKLLSDEYARFKSTRESLDLIDNYLYEGDTTLYQTKAVSVNASSAISGVKYKLPWDKDLGAWKITGSWHGGGFTINGRRYSEHALDIKSPLSTATFETNNEIPIISPISGNISSRCNFDPYNNGYVLIKGDDGIYYSIIHIKVNSITVKTGDRVLQGQYLGNLFEDGQNQDRWTIGQNTSGRCAWAAGTHIHLGMIPVNNNNLINSVRIYDIDGNEMQYPNKNGNATVGKQLFSTQDYAGDSTIPPVSSTSQSSSSVSSTTSSNANATTFSGKYNLNVRKCAGTNCSRIKSISAGSVQKVVCKYLVSSNTYWVRIDNNPIDSVANNSWIIATSYYGSIKINNATATISDNRIPLCNSSK